MDLIIGGAYQGKLSFAKTHFALTDSDVANCDETELPLFGAKCINGIEKFALYCVKNGKDAVAVLKTKHELWKNSVIICTDIFCGVVPCNAEMRAWREATGKMCAYLSGEAKSVTRLFCGLPQKLK